MKTFSKLLIASSLLCSIFTACSDDIEDNGNGTGTSDSEWISVTMKLSDTTEGSNIKEDLPLTKARVGELWELSTALDKNDKIPGKYPLDYVYLVVVSNDYKSCQATKATITNNQLTWLLKPTDEGKIEVRGKNIDNENKSITLYENAIVYFASQENILRVEAGEYDLLGRQVYAPIGDRLFVSPNALYAHFDSNQIILESKEINPDTEKIDHYVLPMVQEETTAEMEMINLQRATTVLTVQVSFETPDASTAYDTDYILNYLNQQLEKRGKEKIQDLSTQFRARFFFAGYPNAYDMTRENPIGGTKGEYTAISYKWSYPMAGIPFPLSSEIRAYSGFSDYSTPYITPHDYTKDFTEGQGNITSIYLTFEILEYGAEETAEPLYRGTIKGDFLAFDVMKRNTHMNVLYTLPLSELNGLLDRPHERNLVTRSAVEDELFGTMLDAKVEVDYLVK